MAQPRRISHGRAQIVGIPAPQMEPTARLPAPENAVGFQRESRFEYEFHDDSVQWCRPHRNENWECDELGYMKFRYASINNPAWVIASSRKLRRGASVHAALRE